MSKIIFSYLKKMESLSQIFSPFDNLEIICEEHSIPCIGLCCNLNCNERTKLFCMKCIKSGNTCITKEKHELITLSEMLYRYFLKEENNYSSIYQIQEMKQVIKDINADELNKVTSNFQYIQSDKYKKISEIKNILMNMIKEIIQLFKEQNIDKLNKLKFNCKTQSNLNNKNNLDELLKFKLPKEALSKNKEELIKYINNQYKSEKPNALVNSAKILYDTHNFSKISKEINEKNFLIETTSLNDLKKKNMESKIDKILSDFESEFDEKLKQIEEEIIITKNISSIYNNSNRIVKFKNDPQELEFKEDICSTAHKSNSIDRVFCAFKSFSGEALIVWGSNALNLEFYDCEKAKIIKTYFKAHNQTIFSTRHYPDSRKRIDYIITSSYDRTVKVWDHNQPSYVLNIMNAHTGYYMYSVCMLFNIQENTDYIITSSSNDKMKVWNFKGQYLRSFGQDTDSTYFIDTYYSKEKKQHYVINANNSDVKCYYFNNGNLFQKYKGTPQTWHMSVIINETKNGEVLIESDGCGRIRVWDFNTAVLLKNILSQSSINLRGICLWNDKYLFASGNDYQVKLFDIEEGKFIKSYKAHTATVCTIEKIMHPKFGGCLISQGLDGKLKLWAPKEE